MASASENNLMPPIDIDAAAPEEEETTHLFRQTSVYSLTLDEFQNTVCEPGKNFGSMNMDEFIANIWTVEESQAVAAAMEAAQANPNPKDRQNIMPQIGRQPSLHRQSSLTIPAPLSRKTVEEVWTEIHRDKGDGPDQQVDSSAAVHHGTGSNNSQQNGGNSKGGSAARQPTFGEMTLEDFLIKAGVVREGLGSSSSSKPQPQPQPQQYGYLSGNNINGTEPADYSVSSGNHVISYGYNAAANEGGAAHARGVQTSYQAFPQQQQASAAVGEGMSNYSGGSSGRNGSFPAGGCFGGRIGNGSSMAGSGFGVGCGSPVMSPMPSDGVCGGSSQGVDNSVSQYGLETEMGGGGVVRGSSSRKRGGGGSVEKGVERRQRRMIKNRESAARSRARKQAYTVELEAELEMLKEENARLRREHEEEEAKRKKKVSEAVMAKFASAKGMKPKPLRRTFTGPW